MLEKNHEIMKTRYVEYQTLHREKEPCLIIYFIITYLHKAILHIMCYCLEVLLLIFD